MNTAVRAFDPTRDRAALEQLWSAALQPEWPIEPDALDVIPDGEPGALSRP